MELLLSLTKQPLITYLACTTPVQYARTAAPLAEKLRAGLLAVLLRPLHALAGALVYAKVRGLQRVVFSTTQQRGPRGGRS